ncbi:MAG: DUF2147 domain-containing protein [Alphaproteobacteria bacterium]|nr:DUF2147 domain-containing protein [Alphaproteobacteria bacterium]
MSLPPFRIVASTLFTSLLLAAVPFLPQARAQEGVEPVDQTTAAFAEITGMWLTEGGEGGVELYRCEEKLCGRFVWLGPDDPDPASDEGRDNRNPDPTKRKRPLCGMQFMGGFEFSSYGTFDNGWIYSPRHGNNFSARIVPVDHDHIKLRGYFLMPMLGQDQIWTRKNDMPRCRTSEDAAQPPPEEGI